MTPEQCDSQFEATVDLLISNARKYMIPEMLSRPKAEKWLRESIEEAKDARSRSNSQLRSAVSEIRRQGSMSSLFQREMRLQRGNQRVPPKDGDLPR
jgi:hypothetical protein